MATLSGNTISDTYDGLLKLEDSTSGITSTFQDITDGLGNPTGLRIKEGELLAPNIQTYKNYTPKYLGPGISSSVNPGTNISANSVFIAFYDTGVHSYSALTYNLGTTSSSNDTGVLGLYYSEIDDVIGVYPSVPLLTGLTMDLTGSTGLKTIVFPSPISFSGVGAGVYFLKYNIDNGNSPGTQYTARVGLILRTAQMSSLSDFYGVYVSRSATSNWGNFQATNSPSTPMIMYSGLVPENPITPAVLNSAWNPAVTSTIGWLFNVVR